MVKGTDSLAGGMVLGRAAVLFNRKIAADHFQARLKAPAAARRARPGQFVHVLCEGTDRFRRSPLLRRPLSLSDADPRAGTIDFIYKIVGLGTDLLARVRPGDQVDFMGPLGRPFEAPSKNRTACLVGGGVGIPPLLFLAKHLSKRGRTAEVFLGARTKKWMICAIDFRKLDLPVHLATDDGSLGHCGSVVKLLAETFLSPRSTLSKASSLFICGPTPMMAAVARLARERGLPAQVSLEEKMGCAMGVCMGCVVEVATAPAGSHARYKRVCTEGPVFASEEILWR